MLALAAALEPMLEVVHFDFPYRERGYPLHPAGKPDKLRDAHLGAIKAPVLCFNGTRDELCDRALMEKTVGGLKGWTQHWLEGAKHSFADRATMEEIARVTAAWLRGCTDIQ